MKATSLQQAIAERDQTDVRLHHLAEQVQALGPAPMLHAMIDIAGGADLQTTLERYAALDPDFISALGGDRFARPLHVVSKGEAA